MDATPSRRMSFALQLEETTSKDEILIDDRRRHGMRGSETGRSDIIVGMEVGLESGYSKTNDVEPGSPRSAPIISWRNVHF